jgi:hypothetical protein
MLENGIEILGWDPHGAARSVLLEMAFVFAPEIKVFPGGQTAQFFYMPAGLRGRPEQ